MLEDYRYDAKGCVRCSDCKWIDPMYMKSSRFSKICPINARYFFDSYSAQGLMDIALGVIDGKLRFTPKLLDALYRCTLCGACDIMCKRCLDLEVLDVIHELRIKSVQDGRGPMPEHMEMAKRVEENHNVYGEAHDERMAWMPEHVKQDEKADTVYFVGCASAYRNQEIALATSKILEAGGVGFKIIDERCCGGPVYKTGQTGLAKKLMEHNVEAIERAGASRVVTSCAECYHMLKIDYPRLTGRDRMDFDVIHITELMDGLVKDGKLRFRSGPSVKVTYHDPCYLGRLGEPYVHWRGKRKKFGRLTKPKEFRRGTHGVYDPPRNVLRSIPGVEIVEMERIRENTWCSGGSYELKVAFDDFALWTAKERVEEACSTEADAIVTCCPFAKTNLKEAAEKMNRRIPVYDVTEMVAKSIEAEAR
ncbi:MAG: (Fe-S)-binding protein [Candidatus Bathyarchaeia archaeon]